MKEFVFDYENLTFSLYIPAYWDTIYAGKPREQLYNDYCLMLDIVKKTKKDRYVLDIGANHGLFSVPASKMGYKVICFEPVESNAKSLTMARDGNDLSDFHIFQMALSNVNGQEYIFIPECPDNASFSQAAAVSNMRRKEFHTEAVSMVKFDDWICERPEFIDIGIIKIDVQGSEYNVFDGMGDFLKGANDIYIICEYEHHLNNMGHTFEELDKLITSYGFHLIGHLTPSDKLFYKP